jgi:radical SAM protein with 4Fe4S-binding SPASM domain
LIYGSCLYQWIGIDHSGDIYPCGRSYTVDYQIGSILEINHISDIFRQDNFIELLKKSIIRRSMCQNDCTLFGICNGGCNNNALIENGRIEMNGGFLCVVLKDMYEYISMSIETILSEKGSVEKYNPLVKQAINKNKLEETFVN